LLILTINGPRFSDYFERILDFSFCFEQGSRWGCPVAG